MYTLAGGRAPRRAFPHGQRKARRVRREQRIFSAGTL